MPRIRVNVHILDEKSGKERQDKLADSYTGQRILEGLLQEGFLEPLPPDQRYQLLLLRNGLPQRFQPQQSLAEVGATDGDQLQFTAATVVHDETPQSSQYIGLPAQTTAGFEPGKAKTGAEHLAAALEAQRFCSVTGTRREDVERAYQCGRCGTWYSEEGWGLKGGQCPNDGNSLVRPIRWREDQHIWETSGLGSGGSDSDEKPEIKVGDSTDRPLWHRLASNVGKAILAASLAVAVLAVAEVAFSLTSGRCIVGWEQACAASLDEPTAVVTPIRQPVSSPTLTPLPTFTTLPSATPVPSATPPPTSPPTRSPTPQATVSENYVLAVAVDVFPTPNGERLTQLRAGTVIGVVGKKGDFWEVVAESPLVKGGVVRGWIVTRSLTPTPPAASPTATPQAPNPTASGGRIGFAVVDGTRTYKLYVVNPDGSGLTGIGDCMRQPDFRPDGQRIVVNGEGCGRDDLWSSKPDGSDLQKVTNFPLDQRPVWAVSRGTYHVAFDSTRATSGQSYIYVDDRQVSYGSGAILGQYVVVLPPESIVYSGCDYGFGGGSTCGMYRTSLWGGKPTSVSTNPGDLPTDADAAGILFMRSVDRNWDIYLSSADGLSVQRLTESPANDGLATFSPDGSSIAFISNRSGSWALWVMNRDGSDQRKLLDLPEGGGLGTVNDWTSERISWGALPAPPTPVPTQPGGDLLTPPTFVWPRDQDVINPNRPYRVEWTWSLRALGENEGFEVRIQPSTGKTPLQGVAVPQKETYLNVGFNATDAYRANGRVVVYNLDVVVVQLTPYKILSRSAPIRIRLDPGD